MILPSHIPVPVSTAEQIRFEGDLGPKDIGYAIAVAHLASLAAPDKSDWYRIPDNRLRAELGWHRRETIIREQSRFERLRDGVIVHDTLGRLPMPTAASRNNRHDELPWMVEPIVREMFEPEPESVMLPVEVLRNCRNRHTTTFVLRMLALLYLSPGEVKRSGRGFVHVAIKADDLSRLLGLPASSKPSMALRDYLVPIAADLNGNTNISVEVEPVYVRTLSTPKGRLRHFEILMSLPPESALEHRMRQIETSASEKPGAWRQRPAAGKVSKPRPAPASAEPVRAANNVSVLRPRFGRGFGRPIDTRNIGRDTGEETVEF